jgi:prepilin-type N-terminal cleavage/methylation domain-containing protein
MNTHEPNRSPLAERRVVMAPATMPGQSVRPGLCAHGIVRPRTRRAFTLVELLVTIAILAVLMGLALSGLMAVRKSQKRTESLQLVNQLHQAMGVYAQMDRRGKFPNPDTGGGLLVSGVAGLLESEAGYMIQRPRIVETANGPALCDAWNRALLYAPDLIIDTTIARPAPLPDWNPKGKEPYPYVYSLGNPLTNGNDDALPANASRWLYHSEGP